MFKKSFLPMLVLALMALVVTPVQAKKNREFPLGCKQVGFQFKRGHLVLKPDNPSEPLLTIFFIHNRSDHPVQMAVVANPRDPFPVDQENVLEPDGWGAFVQNEPEVTFYCAAKDDSHHHMDCAEVLSACQYPNAKFAEHNTGTYWIATADTRNKAVKETIHAGVLLKW